MNTFEIKTAIENCKTPIVDLETGEITGYRIDIEAIKALEVEKDNKLDNLIAVINDKKNKIAERKKQTDKYKAWNEKDKEDIGKLEDLISYLVDGKKYETALNKIFWRTSKAVQVENADVLPDEFVSIKTTRTPKKKEISAYIKDGGTLDGVTIIEKKNINIR